ncbi:hypothetical protein [Ehrlichia canis]|uniref:Uncharacterized protein n=2 Tax=Ehrlichia canis TaxID=944 RepID=A0ACA6AXA4_EHRCJ|nr:hypothetical protein [Ehrlichia canis]AAK28682.1 unknown function U2 [Ehrlichia canis]AAZ68928.1 hypothetical protein Ecaj_0897 [Ehrlichia canis str. Jake]AUO55131.1 hypothetical protein C1I72_04720 [Ehrlichia canis]UKC53712.1 hypothetical protein s20019040002_000755 [Ehrlichia canis]UKC54650.1 hypothetical protein s20026770001_000756 [Ehrlichia canis]
MNNKVLQNEVLLLLALPYSLHNSIDIEYNEQPIKKLSRLNKNTIKSQLKHLNYKYILLKLKKISSIGWFLKFSNDYSNSQVIYYLRTSLSKLVSTIALFDFKNIFLNYKVLTDSLRNFSANYYFSKHHNITNCFCVSRAYFYFLSCSY